MEHSGTTPKPALVPIDSKALVDAFLEPLLLERTEQARRINPHYETLWQAIYTLFTAGGKRLRSYMTLLSYSSFTDDDIKTILPAAGAQELLHTAMLIHDDIIDRDDIRYGVKTIERQYVDHYEELIHTQQDRRHYAKSAAILAGDLLISEAYTLLTEISVDPSRIIASQRLLGHAIYRVIGGELLDTEAPFRNGDAASPVSIAEQKTASYSFVSPLLMGATLAGASETQLTLLQQFGEQLGIAYQLRDDLLGIFGDSDVTGKSSDNDLREGKRTSIIETFEARATVTEKEMLQAVLGNQDATPKELAALKTSIIENGTKAAIEADIAAYQERCVALLSMLHLSEQHTASFTSLIDLCLKRVK